MGCMQGKEGSANRQKKDNVYLCGKRFDKELSTNEDEEELRLNNQQFVKISAIRVEFSTQSIESFQLAYEISSGSIVPGRTHSKIVKDKDNVGQGKEGRDKNSKNKRVGVDRKNESNKEKERQKRGNDRQVGDNKGNDQKQGINQKLTVGVFEILEDDYLKEFSCNISDTLELLSFRTYKGHSVTYGGKSKNGKLHEIRLSKETFGPFASNSSLNSLKIPVIPVPSSFLTSMNKSIK